MFGAGFPKSGLLVDTVEAAGLYANMPSNPNITKRIVDPNSTRFLPTLCFGCTESEVVIQLSFQDLHLLFRWLNFFWSFSYCLDLE